MAEIEHEHLLESVADITEQRDLESLEASLVETMCEFVPVEEIALYKIHGQEALLVVRADKSGVESGGSLSGRTDRVVALSANADFMECMGKHEAVVRRAEGLDRFTYPILTEEKVVGFLSVTCAQARQCDQWLIAGLMRIYQNFLSLINESEHDKLTGLLNRKTFDAKIGKILLKNREQHDKNVSVEQRGGQQEIVSNWLAIVDIDHFKRINDSFGHLYGDEVLLLLSRIMRKTFRNNDLLFRYGGEEFVVVLPSVSMGGAMMALERFRSAAESHPFPQVGQVTVSIGFVDMGSQYVPTTVVGQADQALYYAKRNGRNRICLYDDLLASGDIGSGIAGSDVELF